MSVLIKNKAYLFLLLVLHFTPLSLLSTIVQSVLIFYFIGFKKKINLFEIFLLLVPVIAFRSGNSNEKILIETGSAGLSWISYYLPYLQGIIMIGPVAVSTKLFGALGVLVRILINYRKFSIQHFFWFVALVISIIGLYISVSNRLESAGGLTIGVRIVLSIGVLLFPLIVDSKKMYIQLRQIISFSSLLFFFGTLNDHWIFVFAGIVPVLLFYESKSIYKTVSLLAIFILLIFDFTFTVKITTLLSIFICLLLNSNNLIKFLFFKSYILKYVLITFPILIVLFSISGYLDDFFKIVNLEEVSNKFFIDRMPIWTQAFHFILESNPFIVPAGRPLLLENYKVIGESEWGAGAHNIYLEVTRQIGFLSSLIVFGLILITHYRIYFNLKYYPKIFVVLFFSMLSVYMIYGLTGNSLVYDGVGFMYWLILGQIAKLK